MIETENPEELKLSPVEHSEKRRLYIQNAIEQALSFGDFQKELEAKATPRKIIEETIERITSLVEFEACGIYLVDEESGDLELIACKPRDSNKGIEPETDFLINHGFVGWALRERRGVTIYSRDGSHQIFLHVIATYARIRGLFIGIFPCPIKRLPDASLEILSIILRNAANGLESLTYADLLLDQKSQLERIVAEKTHKLIHYERHLSHAQKMEAIAALAGGIAHQFNNALFAMVGYLDLAANITPEESKASDYLKRMRPIADKMAHLTNQLLAYAQGGKYQPCVITLEKLVNDALAMLRKNVRPDIVFDTELRDAKVAVHVDVTQLHTVISAIVNNADEAISGPGQIRLSTGLFSVDQQAGGAPNEPEPGKYACLSIQDTGSGMDETTKRRVFEPFFSTKFEGRGLSMAAVYGIIKNHHGWIELESEPGRGTTVKILLPAVPAGKRSEAVCQEKHT